MNFATNAAITAPSVGASKYTNSVISLPPAKIAGPKLRAAFNEPPVKFKATIIKNANDTDG